jgi:hypothetical protein
MFFKKKSGKEIMFSKKKKENEGIRPTPVVAKPLNGDMTEEQMRARLDDLSRMPQPQMMAQAPQPAPQPLTYVDRKLEEAKERLSVKKSQMMALQEDIHQCINEATILQEIRDGKAVMYITDLLDMIDEYRGADFQDQDELLDGFERDIIQTTIQDLKLKKR